MKVALVCGARPNFMKIAPLIRAIGKHNASSGASLIEPLLVHTGRRVIKIGALRCKSQWLNLVLVRKKRKR